MNTTHMSALADAIAWLESQRDDVFCEGKDHVETLLAHFAAVEAAKPRPIKGRFRAYTFTDGAWAMTRFAKAKEADGFLNAWRSMPGAALWALCEHTPEDAPGNQQPPEAATVYRVTRANKAQESKAA